MSEETKKYGTTTEGFLIKRGEISASKDVKLFKAYTRQDISYLRMKYLFMIQNDIYELENAPFMRWMEGLGWKIKASDKPFINTKRNVHIDDLKMLLKHVI